MQRNRVVDYLVYVVVRLLICIVQAMRIETGQMFATWLAWLFGDVLRIRHKVVDENLAHAFAHLTPAERCRLSHGMWEHLFLLVLEVAHAPRKLHETNWRHYVKLKNDATLVQLMLTDRPTLIVTGHYGNFELAGFVMGILGFPTYTVARTLDNPYLDRFVHRFRGATGQFIIPKNGGFEQILDVVNHGGTMALLADQYAGRKGCWVEFFGRPASAHKSIALLAVQHDAPVAVTASRRLDKPLTVELDVAAALDPCDDCPETSSIKAITQWYTSVLEQCIRQDPTQYWWLHRRWKGDPNARRKPRHKKADQNKAA